MIRPMSSDGVTQDNHEPAGKHVDLVDEGSQCCFVVLFCYCVVVLLCQVNSENEKVTGREIFNS